MANPSSSFNSVLIVDDDPIVRSIAEAAFTNRVAGRIHTANDGGVALEILEQAPDIDFILCDLNMPNMDGLQFLRHVADRQFRGEIGIVSGEDQAIIQSAEIMASKYGLTIRGTLNKPVDFAKIDTLLANSRSSGVVEAIAQSEVFTRNDLVFALVNKDIKPYFQPKICTQTQKLAGAEALARWEHPDLGFIPPASFIPVAENEGLIHTLTGAIIKQSVAVVADWSRFCPDFKVAINLSGEMLTDLQLPDQMLKVCAAAGVDPAQIVLEVTESRVLSSSAMPIEVLARLRMNRFELSVDDFGTGYSNIDRLREFPFTELKIDQSFIRNAGNDDFARKCVLASVDIGRALGLRIVAEGVETAEDYAFVQGLDIDQIQGFYFSKPLPIDAFATKYFQRPAEVA